ncbi:MAG: MgtC/SapB family protein [Clostridiales bacterium]|nr:MgtC/SapB family protein [Clostridiales bacterium]
MGVLNLLFILPSDNLQDILKDLNIISISARIILSIIMGGILGFERGIKNRPAGFRTYILVCLGSTLVMLTNQYVHETFQVADPSRMGAQVVSGIGFLGAGAILITNRNQVKGLTTAAGLWVAACLGLAIGIGFYYGAIIGGLGVLFVLSLLQKVDEKIRTNGKIITLYVEFKEVKYISAFINKLQEQHYIVEDMTLNKNPIPGNENIALIITFKSSVRMKHTEVIQKLSNAEGIEYIGELH